MTHYKELTISDGAKFMPYVWNFFFKPIGEGGFFVEPWNNRELADCAEFRLLRADGLPAEILFFVSGEELARFLLDMQGQLYLFGAYNQVSVCQMRVKGTVTPEEARSDVSAIKERLRANISKRIETLINKLSEKEALVRFELLEHGRLFCFHPEEYAYAMYERG